MPARRKYRFRLREADARLSLLKILGTAAFKLQLNVWSPELKTNV